MRHCFIEDCIDCGDVVVEHMGTDDMRSDCHTKLLQVEKFITFGKKIMNSQKRKHAHFRNQRTIHTFQEKMKNEGVHWKCHIETVMTQELLVR